MKALINTIVYDVRDAVKHLPWCQWWSLHVLWESERKSGSRNEEPTGEQYHHDCLSSLKYKTQWRPSAVVVRYWTRYWVPGWVVKTSQSQCFKLFYSPGGRQASGIHKYILPCTFSSPTYHVHVYAPSWYFYYSTLCLCRDQQDRFMLVSFSPIVPQYRFRQYPRRVIY